MHDMLYYDEMWSTLRLLIIFAFVFGLIWLKRGGRRERGRDEDEARTVQELYQGLTRMEKRVESLETLLMDAERRREK